MERPRLTDEQWSRVTDLFGARKPTGRPPRDRRQVLDGVLWVLNTGAPWRDLPTEFGPWATAWDLFDKWNADGTLAALLQRLQGEVEIDGELGASMSRNMGRTVLSSHSLNDSLP